jgi:C4-dicarboxylate-binding protein DctP
MFMKKSISLMTLIVFALVFVLSGCGSSSTENNDAANDAGSGQKYVIKFAHEIDPSHPKGVWAEDFKKAVEEKSNGQIEVQIFPNGQLYSDDVAATQAVMSGAVEMTAPTSGVLASTIPQFLVFDSPFLFPSLDTAYAYLDSDLGKQLSDLAAQKGMKVVGHIFNSPAELWLRNKEAKVPDDIKGMKIRIFSSPVLENTIKALGANPTTIAVTELYVAMQQGVADGFLSSVTNVSSSKLYEVVKNSTDIHVNQNVYPVILNLDFWNQLPDDLQQVILDAAKEASDKNRKELQSKIDEGLENIKNGGVTIHNLTPEERKQWVDKADSVYKILADKVGEDFLKQTEDFIESHQ